MNSDVISVAQMWDLNWHDLAVFEIVPVNPPAAFRERFCRAD
jgi:hypothetical protein